MARAFDIAKTFIHLDDQGGAAPVPVTPAFWRSASSAGYARLVGAVDFRTAKDLHATAQEIHPAADEVIYLASGALDVIVEDAGGAERRIPLEAGQAAIVPRGLWHRLVVREPGRLVFINSRAEMQSRPLRREQEEEQTCSPI